MDTVAPWMDALHEERRLQVNEQQTSFHNEHRTVDAFADGPGVALLGLIFVLFAVFAAVFALCAYFNVGDRINLMMARRRSSQTAVELPPEVAMTELNDAAEAARAAAKAMTASMAAFCYKTTTKDPNEGSASFLENISDAERARLKAALQRNINEERGDAFGMTGLSRHF